MLNVDLDLTDQESSGLFILDGLTLNGTATLDNGGSLNWSGTQRIDGTGSIVFGSHSYTNLFGTTFPNQLVNIGLDADAETLTLGPDLSVGGADVTISGGALVNEGSISGESVDITTVGVDNQGTIDVDTGAVGIGPPLIPTPSSTWSFDNEGTVATSGGSIAIGYSVVNNNGTIQANSGSIAVWEFNTSGSLLFDNQANGTIEATGGSIAIDSGFDLQSSFDNEGTVESTGGSITLSTSTVDNKGSIQAANGGTVGIGESINGQTGSLNNAGTIEAAGGTIRIEGILDVQSSGTLAASGNGNLDIVGQITSLAGTLDADGGTVTLDYDSTLTLDAADPFTMSGGGVIDVQGTIVNTNNSFALDTTDGTFLLDGGTIQGGTVAAAEHGSNITATADGGTLDGVTLDIDLDVSQQLAVVDVDGLTLNATASLNAAFAGLVFVGTQTLDGDGQVVFTGGSASFLSSASPDDTSATLTIGPDITVSGQGVNLTAGDFSGDDTIINLGQITSGSPITIDAYAFENQGTVDADGGGSFTGTGGGSYTTVGDFDNAGVLSLAPGAFTINGDYTQESTGTLDIGIGGYTAGTDYGQLNVTGAASLDGTLNIRLLNGFVPQLGDSFRVLTFGANRRFRRRDRARSRGWLEPRASLRHQRPVARGQPAAVDRPGLG